METQLSVIGDGNRYPAKRTNHSTSNRQLMDNIDLHEEKTLTLKFGHAFLLWHVLSELAGQTNFKSVFTEMEQKAVWAFEDQLERMLASDELRYSEDEFVDIKKQLEEFVAGHVDADFT